jgi:hypothetical protein
MVGGHGEGSTDGPGKRKGEKLELASEDFDGRLKESRQVEAGFLNLFLDGIKLK